MEWLVGDIPAQNSVLFALLAMVPKQMFFNELGMVLPILTLAIGAT